MDRDGWQLSSQRERRTNKDLRMDKEKNEHSNFTDFM
jgi:hypothetical protein